MSYFKLMAGSEMFWRGHQGRCRKHYGACLGFLFVTATVIRSVSESASDKDLPGLYFRSIRTGVAGG
jgi:hypothetical protein